MAARQAVSTARPDPSHTRVRKAIVPLAGLGTRLFPASHAVKKELFPIVGPDGIARAIVHQHLIDLTAAGIEEICLIVQPGGDADVRRYLAGPDEAYLKRLAPHPALVHEAKEMRAFADRVRFAIQHTQEGYGHAVFQARDFAAGQPALLCLGDHLFRGRRVSPIQEVVAMAGLAAGRSVSAVNRIDAEQLKSYGTIAGRRRQDHPMLIDVTQIVEKPDLETARTRLQVDGLPADTWLGWFGIHLLGPSIFDVLARMIRDGVRDKGEFQLTRAQEIQRQREGHLAIEITDGERFDFGTGKDYVESAYRYLKG
jgi:UTP--glucose-1-phosphate uridylyltransferase